MKLLISLKAPFLVVLEPLLVRRLWVLGQRSRPLGVLGFRVSLVGLMLLLAAALTTSCCGCRWGSGWSRGVAPGVFPGQRCSRPCLLGVGTGMTVARLVSGPYLVVYKGYPPGNPTVIRHIHGWRWSPHAIFLPVVMRTWP